MHRGITINDFCLIDFTVEQTMDILWNYKELGYTIYYDGDLHAWGIAV